mmetsp:Transcript_169629/g.538572  ORF Transcript_169629/g.538572 Transcript_169629/m.538572 type:complete len:303 (-) Transcript_169629:169-1077(-)
MCWCPVAPMQLASKSSTIPAELDARYVCASRCCSSVDSSRTSFGWAWCERRAQGFPAGSTCCSHGRPCCWSCDGSPVQRWGDRDDCLPRVARGLCDAGCLVWSPPVGPLRGTGRTERHEDGSALGIAAMRQDSTDSRMGFLGHDPAHRNFFRPIWVMPNWSGSAQARDHSVDDLHRSLLPPRSFTADAGDYSVPVSAAQGDAAAVAMSASSHMASAFGGMEHSEVRSSAGGVPAMSPFVGGPCASASASGGAGTGSGLAGSSGLQAAAPSSTARSGCSTIGLPSQTAAGFARDPILQPVLAT